MHKFLPCVTVFGVAAVAAQYVSPCVVLFFLALWIWFDGSVVAVDLKSAERRLEELSADLEFQRAHSISAADIRRMAHENKVAVEEILNRLAKIQKHLTRTRRDSTSSRRSDSPLERSPSASKSLNIMPAEFYDCAI